MLLYMKLTRLILCPFAIAGLVLFSGCKEKSPIEKAGDKLKNTTGKATDTVTDGIKAVGDGAQKAYDTTKDAVKDGAHAVSDGVKKGVEKTGEAFEKAGEKIKELGK